MSMEKKEILNESQQWQFLDTPKMIEWFGSYYPEALECNGEKYIIHKKPHELFYPNIYVVSVNKIIPWLEYGDDNREYSTMIFDNWTIKPFTNWLSINNREEMNKKYPIIETEKWYMKYDEHLNCSQLEWLPEWYYPSRWNIKEWTIQLNSNNEGNFHDMIYKIDKNYKLEKIEWIPEWMYIGDIKDDVATLSYYEEKKDDNHKPYFYDSITKTISPFVFEGFEEKSYKIEAYNTIDNVISIIDDQNKHINFYFDWKPKVSKIVTLDVDGKIWELNEKSETARLYSIDGDAHKEWFYFYKDGVVKPFSWLNENEKIWYSETYQFINSKSLVKSLVIIDGDRKHECKTFDNNWTIKPFEWLKEWWKAWDHIRRSTNWDFFFLPIKIKWFGDETHSLLSNDSQRIIFHKDMLISWINPKEKTLTIVTKSWPDCNVQLDNNDRELLMKDRDINYKANKSIESIKEEGNGNILNNLK